MYELLDSYAPISLAEMGGIKLMNRTDTKFVTTENKLLKLLSYAKDGYYVQQVDGVRVADYYTLYFDTPDHDMYLAHHNGRMSRQKLRIRSYMNTPLNFLEVKTKNNHCRTKKVRIELYDFDRTAGNGTAEERCSPMAMTGSRDVGDFLRQHLRYDPTAMLPSIENRFNRITLVNKGKTERLTIDSRVHFHNVHNDARMCLNGIVIIELKRDGLAHSPILDMLRDLRIMPMGFSKYCMGMAMTDDSIKRNLFKQRLHRIERMSVQAAGTQQNQ